MGSKIYVGGLPYSTTEQQLSDLFAAHGSVASARIITDKFTGQSRGFGFVEMSGDSEAQAAIAALNGTQLGGRTLTVNESSASRFSCRGCLTGGPAYILPRIAHLSDASLGRMIGRLAVPGS
jgi:RNA recognition motif-containing protein